MSSMFEFKQQLKWPFNQFQFEVSGNQQPQLTYSISNETSIFSSQDYKISPSTYSTALNDQTQQKKKEKLKKIEERCKQIELYAKFIDEEEPCDEEQVKKQSKPNSKLQIQKYFTCQNININQQFRDHIQIYYGNILIDDQNMKNKLISEIVGDSNQQEEHKNILGEYIQNEQYNIIMNNHFSTRKYFTIQRLYYRKDDTCSVSVKTCKPQNNLKIKYNMKSIF
ncbi:hypothetical protein TTHERM_00391270 (macronuclear) [Tetrahymena thermophila SB210]|uniref:Uncharacterized protein n=1 Tax=Tetrahymena thermophila (strain SB210) TaxID=312017 RepID=Q233M3_TETTS|nr:hypothetical protein TTHERM_00391270 [Tetrahymena thermophila SB210]EAR91557.2 hypothetical protein TTHERM_00391270 [Tetrahymena thermophila SB210]|eukprot:XP_001011802.2 hypothetical protein TTHERM_00391270 [Tetrahymena thermophila SB210]